MNISFNLFTPKAEVSAVRVIITHKGKVYRKAVGLSVPTGKWKNGKCTLSDYNEKLKSVRIKLESALNDFSTDGQIRSALSCDLLGGEIVTDAVVPDKAPSFWGFYEQWMASGHGAERQKKYTKDLIQSFFGSEMDWKDFTLAWYYKFVDKMDERGLSKNTQGNHIGRIKTVMNMGLARGYHNNKEHQKWVKFKEAVTNVYLTDEEMERIWNYESKDKWMRQARDLAYLGYKTAVRYSDTSRLSMDNVVGGKLRFRQEKTDGDVVLPCSPRVVEIFERNGGKAPKMAQQRFNKYIKDICRDCGINDKVEIVVSKGDKHTHEIREKWELVASHTFRRSAIVALHLAGVPARQLMFLSGHTTLDSFFKYLCISKEDNATRLQGLEFFK